MNKIIGSGLISRQMVNLNTHSDCLIIGAGVSNSSETSASEFQREATLIESMIGSHRSLRVVYFSTCSVGQSNHTPYTSHKLAMEEMISSLAHEWCIYRLPQVVGVVNNTTLVSYLVRSVLKRAPMRIQEGAYRYLIDVDDVVRVCESLLNSDEGLNSVQSIAPLYAAPVIEIVKRISRLLEIDANYELVAPGESYRIDTRGLMACVGGQDKIFTESYWCGVLDKYIPRLRNISC